jgi:threonyl-tRNA synthetase
VDFNSGNKFGLTFKNANNEDETPLIIHRAPLGTHERYIAFLIEHFAGNFPTWLAPQQVAILPISDKFMDYGKTILHHLKEAGVRVKLDERNEKIGKKIRDAEMMKVPYMIVIGQKDIDEGKVSVRIHGKGDVGSMPLEDFSQHIQKEIQERAIEHLIK